MPTRTTIAGGPGHDTLSVTTTVSSRHRADAGKVSLLLQAMDGAGNISCDVQRAWIDDEPIKMAIVGIGNQAPCSDTSTQTSEGVFKTVTIRGYARDPYVDTGDLGAPSSSNLDHRAVRFITPDAVGVAAFRARGLRRIGRSMVSHRFRWRGPRQRR